MERPRKLHIVIINLRGAQTKLIHAIQASVVVLLHVAHFGAMDSGTTYT